MPTRRRYAHVPPLWQLSKIKSLVRLNDHRSRAACTRAIVPQHLPRRSRKTERRRTKYVTGIGDRGRFDQPNASPKTPDPLATPNAAAFLPDQARWQVLDHRRPPPGLIASKPAPGCKEVDRVRADDPRPNQIKDRFANPVLHGPRAHVAAIDQLAVPELAADDPQAEASVSVHRLLAGGVWFGGFKAYPLADKMAWVEPNAACHRSHWRPRVP
jgi:hypothetical protein